MKSANFNSRKPKARRIVLEDDDIATKDVAPADVTMSDAPDSTSSPVFKAKIKRKPLAKVRLDNADSTEDEEPATFVIKKSQLSRQAVERSAATKARPLLPPSTATKSLENLTLSSDRPSYSLEALKELRTSTPTTPRDLPPTENDPLDIASKFATENAQKSASGIPEQSMIEALKSRRALLAANPDYISLSNSNTSSKNAHEQRLSKVGDDDEAFERYVDDGGIALGKKAEKVKAAKRREAIKHAIEGSDDDDSGESDSDDNEMEEWERIQIQSGALGTAKRETLEQKLKKAPAVMTPLPKLADALGKLEGLLAGMNMEREKKVGMLGDLTKERAEIEKREKEVQEMLRVKGEAYERLRGQLGAAVDVGRGLESFGDDRPARIVHNEEMVMM